MATSAPEIDETLTEAIVLWIGPVPSLDHNGPATVRARFGDVLGALLLPRISDLVQEFYSTQSRYEVRDFYQKRDPTADFRAAHPEIGEHAVHALTCRYGFDYK